MDYYKSWEDAEAEMLQTQKSNRQYATRSGVISPAALDKTDAKKKTNQTNSAITNRGGTLPSRGGVRRTTQPERPDGQSVYKNGTSWYNSDEGTQTDIRSRDIYKNSSNLGVKTTSTATKKTTLPGLEDFDFKKYLDEQIKAAAKNSTKPTRLDIGRYGVTPEALKKPRDDLLTRVGLLKPEERPTEKQIDFMSGFLADDPLFVKTNEKLKRAMQAYLSAPPPSAAEDTSSNISANIQTLLKAPTRDNLEDELALRKRLSAMDPTLTDPEILAELETKLVRADLMNPNNREVLLRGEGTALAPSDETDDLSIEDKNALFAAQKAIFNSMPDGLSTRDKIDLFDAQKTIYNSFTDEQRKAIENGANASNFIADLSIEDQDRLIDAGEYLISKMDDRERSDWLFLSSWMLNGIPLEQRKAILQHMKDTDGDIDLQTLTNLGVYTAEDAAAGYTRSYLGGLLKENYGEDFVDSLRKEYEAHQLGTSFAEMSQEEMKLRAAVIGGLISENLLNFTNSLAFGQGSVSFGNGRLDQLEKNGAVTTPVKSVINQTSDEGTAPLENLESVAVDSVSDSQGKYPLENGPYIKNGKPNGRPTLSGKQKLEFEQAVYDRCVGKDGVLRDPNTLEIIDWKPGQPRKGVVDFGHVPGKSYDIMFKKYRNGKISLQDLKDFQFNPNNYRLETPSANRSHKYE